MSPATLKTTPLYSPIRASVTDFLGRCKIPLQRTPIDSEFLGLCQSEAKSRGYVMEGEHSLRPFIPGGVVMALTGYAHLEDTSARVLIALYTACGIYLDDRFKKNVDAVAKFNERFLRGQPHGDPVLDAFADLILEMFCRFPRVTANMMVSSTMNGVNALLLEYETRNMQVHQKADNYATFSRLMSGASECYALFAFPSTIPIEHYIQALPDLMIFINNGNDILSFYKEDGDGETVNRISLLAACHGSEKTEELQKLVNDGVEANDRIVSILEPHPEALDAYKRFRCGFIGFHATLKRYRLDELSL